MMGGLACVGWIGLAGGTGSRDDIRRGVFCEGCV